VARPGLTPGRRRFVPEYLVGLNAPRAAIRAGCKVESAEDIGRRLCRKSPVRRAVREEVEIRAARPERRADRGLQGMMRIAFSDTGHPSVRPEAGRARQRPHAPAGAEGAPRFGRAKTKRRVVPRGGSPVEQTETVTGVRMWDTGAARLSPAGRVGLLKPPEPPPPEAGLAALRPDLAGQVRAFLAPAVAGRGRRRLIDPAPAARPGDAPGTVGR
jgi:phage terminase small subunit